VLSKLCYLTTAILKGEAPQHNINESELLANVYVFRKLV